MDRLEEQRLSRETFLKVANNILYKTLLETPRTEAKQIYRAVEEGKRVALMTVRMENGADVRFDLTLDHSEFRGKLNFGAFRANLGTLVAAMTEQIRDGRSVPVFTDDNTGAMLFGVAGPTVSEGDINVLMLAADLSGAGSVHLKLQFMPPQQFESNDNTG